MVASLCKLVSPTTHPEHRILLGTCYLAKAVSSLAAATAPDTAGQRVWQLVGEWTGC